MKKQIKELQEQIKMLQQIVELQKQLLNLQPPTTIYQPIRYYTYPYQPYYYGTTGIALSGTGGGGCGFVPVSGTVPIDSTPISFTGGAI